MEPSPKRFRFNIEADIYMLREVREQDPYRNPTLLLSIAENLSLALVRSISARAIRDAAFYSWHSSPRKTRPI
ncbi:hypothetical protein MTO96_051059 [Rhipicephalus appendiculatus]